MRRAAQAWRQLLLAAEAGGRLALGAPSIGAPPWRMPAGAPFPTPAQLQQAAGVKHHGVPHASRWRWRGMAGRPPRPPRSALARAAATAGKALAAVAVAVPLAATAALLLTSREHADTAALLQSLPRTAAAVWWGLGSTRRYKALAAAHGGDRESAAYKADLAAAHEAEAQRLLLLCQSNGGLYIKAGQLLVSMPGRHLPQEYATALSSLQDRVPPKPLSEIQGQLERELGRPLDDAYAEFEPQALAAASLAQVHRARLLDGRRVAVKIQFPGLEAAADADLATMIQLSRVAAYLFPDSDYRWLFEELQRKLRYELDFRNEANNSARFAALMAGRRDVAVPAVYGELSGRRVLTMDWVDGCRVSDADALQARGLVPREVAEILLDVFAQCQFETGFIHGDPHSGNILVRAREPPAGWLARWWAGGRPRPQLVLLDHGLYVELAEDLRRAYCQLWGAIILGDPETAHQAAVLVCGERAARILPEVLRPRDWSKATREERKRFVAESGISSLADFSRLLAEAPRPLLDTLRLGTVVRHTAAALGATVSDRLRINATHAWRGMGRVNPGAAGAAGAGAGWCGVGGAAPQEREEGPPAYLGAFASRWVRWRLAARVWALRLAFWVKAWVDEVLAAA